MSRYSCNVIRDLLPLYVDDCLSEESRQIVASHLEECWDCRQSLIEMRTPFSPAPYPDENAAAKVLRRGMQKLRNILATAVTIVTVVLCIAIVFLGIKGIVRWVGYEPVDLNFQTNCYFFTHYSEGTLHITEESTFSIDGTSTPKRNSTEMEQFRGYAEVAKYPIAMDTGAGWFVCGLSEDYIFISCNIGFMNSDTSVSYFIQILREDPSVCLVNVMFADSGKANLVGICGKNEEDAQKNYEKYLDFIRSK